MINFQPLFTTARVITAVYRIASTTLLLIYLVHRVSEGKKVYRGRRVDSYDNTPRKNFSYRDQDRIQ